MWLKRLFCGDTISELEHCREIKEALISTANELEIKLDECKEKKRACMDEKADLYAQIAKLTEDAAWFQERLQTLEKALKDAVVIPELDINEDDLIVVKPYEETVFSGYDFKAADLEYYLLPYSKWIEVLTPVQKEVKESLIKWEASISDCDNFAYLMGSLLSVAFRRAGLDKQGAFMITWSRSHAYNAFMDIYKRVWIYEPQNNTVVGKLEEGTDSYETRMIWFLGARL